MNRRSLFIIIVLVCASHASTFAIELIVDQQNPVNFSGGSFGINLNNSGSGGVFSRIGQVFTPSRSSMDAVIFFLQDTNRGNGSGLSIYVEIVTPDLLTVLATSHTVTLPDSFGGPLEIFDAEEVLFHFDQPVTLVPGVAVAARLRKVDGDLFWVTGGRSASYGGGYYTAAAFPTSPEDLFFREGIVVPEPSSIVLAAFGAVGLLAAALRKRRQSALRRS